MAMTARQQPCRTPVATANIPAAGAALQWLPFLDGIRGVLAFTVALSHGTNLMTGFDPAAPAWMRFFQALGGLCVPGFIFLSGFCLGLPAVRKGFRLDPAGRFWQRRAWRILPAYYAALVFAIVVALFVTHTFHVHDLLRAKPEPNLVGPLFLIHDVYGGAPYDGPLWSLAPEVHIYLCFPILLWLFRRLPPAAAAIAWLAAACVSQHFAGLHGHGSLSFYLYGIFAVGVYAAWRFASGPPLPPPAHLTRLAGLAAAALALLAFDLGYVRFWAMLPALSVMECLVLLPVFGLLFQQPEGGLRRFLESAAVQALGKISYSLYLTHWVVLTLVLLLIPHAWPVWRGYAALLLGGIPASVALAAVFYRLFEQPFLTRRRKATP